MHCNHRVVSLETHYTYDLDCAFKEGCEARADLKLRDSIAKNLAASEETEDQSYMEEDPNNEEDPPTYN